MQREGSLAPGLVDRVDNSPCAVYSYADDGTYQNPPNGLGETTAHLLIPSSPK